MLSPTRFRFLNEDNAILSAGEWNSQSLPKLWLYNLHYFDDLNAETSAARKDCHRELIARWITENSPGEGIGWEPYPLSLRIINWIKWALAGNVLSDEARQSLAVQVRFLTGRLERHLLGNHLFANAKALVFAGCFFDSEEAAGWLRLGMEILEREIPEQILADGGHFERSTMYHALAFEDMLDLANLANVYPETLTLWKPFVSSWSGIVGKMGGWLRVMSHPDGEIAFFNDAAIGIAPPPISLFDYAERLGLPLANLDGEAIQLNPSGYIRIAIGPAVLLIDVAPVGPDYLPGHAHADTLSYELSLYGHRVVVNSGTSRYGLGQDREWERSTAAHTTLEIDGKNSSEVWAGFRVARRAYPIDVSVRHENGATIVEAAHDGYCRLPDRPVHRRCWVLRSDCLLVSDLVDGAINQAVSRVYFHPALQIEKVGAGGTGHWGGHNLSWAAKAGEISIRPARWYPEFGIDVENRCVEMSDTRGKAVFSLNW
ncbi:MAG: alginate lyase family protein [Rhodoferax sp.]|nr:alginate lyase family protein [Rhodoferax sp.]